MAIIKVVAINPEGNMNASAIYIAIYPLSKAQNDNLLVVLEEKLEDDQIQSGPSSWDCV